jgi:hypothetical protein
MSLMGRPEESLHAIDEALRVGPHCVHSWLNRAEALSQLGGLRPNIEPLPQVPEVIEDAIEAYQKLSVSRSTPP